jgi:hypothetical protein
VVPVQAVAILARTDLRRHWRAAIALTLLIGLPAGLVLATAAGARRTETAYGRFLRSTVAADAAAAPSGADGTQNVGALAAYYTDLARRPGVAVVLLALAIGLPLGVIAGSEAWRFFAGRLGVAPELRVPWLGLIIAVPVVLAVGNLIAVPPALAARRLRPADVLRSE